RVEFLNGDLGFLLLVLDGPQARRNLGLQRERDLFYCRRSRVALRDVVEKLQRPLTLLRRGPCEREQHRKAHAVPIGTLSIERLGGGRDFAPDVFLRQRAVSLKISE